MNRPDARQADLPVDVPLHVTFTCGKWTRCRASRIATLLMCRNPAMWLFPAGTGVLAVGYKFTRDDESTMRDVPIAFALGAVFALSILLTLIGWRLLIGRFPFVSGYTKRGTVLAAEFGYDSVVLTSPRNTPGVPSSVSYRHIKRVSRFRHAVYLNTGDRDDMYVFPRELFPESALGLMRRAGVRM